MRPIPINSAETIIAQFWDPHRTEVPDWEIGPLSPREEDRSFAIPVGTGDRWSIMTGVPHGLRVAQNWFCLSFEWSRTPDIGPAMRLRRTMEVDCRDFHLLMISAMLPPGSTMDIHLETDIGSVSVVGLAAKPLQSEYSLALAGASTILAIEILVNTSAPGSVFGWINWIGLQNTELLPAYLAQWKRFDAVWDGYLVPEGGDIDWNPVHGFLIADEELDRVRARHAAHLAQHGTSPFVREADAARDRAPEELIGDFVNFWDDTRLCRERDLDRPLVTRGGMARVAIGATLVRDPDLLRLAARYAMSIGMCGHWDDTFEAHCPEIVWEHRAFVSSVCILDVALTLDLAGGLFTDYARQYLLRKIAQEAIGFTNFAVWKHEYMFHGNQLAWFSPSRLLGYILLEQSQPRVRPYTDLAYQELVESTNLVIQSDGGFLEGPTYATWFLRCLALSLWFYSRARDVPFLDLVPDSVKRAGDYADAILSLDETQDVIPLGDAMLDPLQEGLAFMAVVRPDSQWVRLYRRTVAKEHDLPNNILSMLLEHKMAEQSPEPPAFTFLPVSGLVSSVRRVGSQQVKILVAGSPKGSDHTHEDKGSFVLEFAGETFAMDPGMCDYSLPLSDILTQCQRHNMLVPTGVPERPRSERVATVDVLPTGEGDDQRFSARIDATPTFSTYFDRWVREWESPEPGELLVRDSYALRRGSGVEAYWNTKLDVTVGVSEVTITGRKGRAVLTLPTGCTVRVDDLPLADETIQRRIAIQQEGTQGELCIRVRLEEIIA